MKPTEVEWLGTYEAWAARIEDAQQTGFIMPRAACEAAYDDEVGDPPNARLEPVSAAARWAARSESRLERVAVMLALPDTLCFYA